MGKLGDDMVWASVMFGALSAVSWLLSALITPVITASYWDGPPAPLVRRMKFGSALNATGALFGSIAVGLQAYSTYLTMP
ncbi:UNVERIFIED_ORG: hypothetical protein J2W66_003161 [Agrobacterium larrymoorei]|jgi:hypothetical protein|nr:hypothetical protein [Agrobacterium larrymoorei]